MNEQVLTKTIRVFGRVRQTKPVDGKKQETFVAYTYTNNGLDFYNVKFTKECFRRPSKPGYYLLKVDLDKVNLKYGKKGDNNRGTLWIKEVIDFQEDTKYAEEVKAKKQRELEKVLSDDELPF